MQLSDKDIYKALKMGDIIFLGTNEKYPFLPERQIQASTVDLRLGNRILKFSEHLSFLDFAIHDPADFMEEIFLKDGEPIVILPHQIVFAQTYEQVYIDKKFAGRIEGRSRTARAGIAVHCTGSNMNPGFRGSIALQIMNCNNFTVSMYPYMDICQIMFYQLTAEPLIPFGFFDEPYQNEKYPAPSNLTAKSTVLKDEGSSIMRARAQLLLEEYLKKLDIENHSLECNPVDTKILLQNYFERIDSFQMGDHYDAENVGIQGGHAGKYAKVEQDIHNIATKGDIESVIIAELTILNECINDSAILSKIENSICEIKNGNWEKALKYIRSGGTELYNLAYMNHCFIIAGYLMANIELK